MRRYFSVPRCQSAKIFSRCLPLSLFFTDHSSYFTELIQQNITIIVIYFQVYSIFKKNISTRVLLQKSFILISFFNMFKFFLFSHYGQNVNCLLYCVRLVIAVFQPYSNFSITHFGCLVYFKHSSI